MAVFLSCDIRQSRKEAPGLVLFVFNLVKFNLFVCDLFISNLLVTDLLRFKPLCSVVGLSSPLFHISCVSHTLTIP